MSGSERQDNSCVAMPTRWLDDLNWKRSELNDLAPPPPQDDRQKFGAQGLIRWFGAARVSQWQADTTNVYFLEKLVHCFGFQEPL